MAYKWTYCRLGGTTRVNIKTTEDLKHLNELDKKMWTVTSCPVNGLEIDTQSLKYIDTNSDGSIHVDEVIAVSQWLSRVLTDLTPVLKGSDTLSLNLINQADEEGKKLYDSAQQILKEVGKADAQEISLAEASSSLAAFLKNKLEAALAAIDKDKTMDAPYGDDTDAIEAAWKALDAKVGDYFMRARLSQFAAESTAALDVQVSQIEAISADNLTSRMEQIAAYPLARIEAGVQELPLDAAINPAWAGQWSTVSKAFDTNAKTLTPEAWAAIGAAIKAYRDYQASITVTEADIKLDDETAEIQLVDKLLHLTRDFYQLLRNYVTLSDFYDPSCKAIFQAGTMLIDQRTLELCIRVSDAGAQAAQAPKSSLFLLFCDCISKVKGTSMKIMAAVTAGDVDDLFVGKNAIFYDREGNDYDAKVTAIIENPISVRQAMWTPYKKMAKFIEDQINKFAADKEAGVMNNATATITEKTEAAKAADTTNAAGASEAGKQVGSFDIAKYAGIFAAVGMAVGMIGTALVAVAKGFLGLTWWQMPLVILAIMLVISAPSMFIAWSKLRRRNLAPVLNANGWAINAAARINIPFGATLTQLVHLPAGSKVSGKDPFAEKTPLWRKLLYFVIVLVILAISAHLVAKRLGFDCPLTACCCC